MSLISLRTAGVLVSAALLSLTMLNVTRSQEAEPEVPDFGLPKLETLDLQPTTDELLLLKQDRYRAAKEHYDLLLPRMAIEPRFDHLSQAIQRVIDAEHDLTGSDAGRIKCLEKSVDLHRAIEKITSLLFEHGRIPQSAVPLARHERIMAEIRLQEAKRKIPRQ